VDQQDRAGRRESARRYRRRSKPTVAQLRVRDLNRLLNARYGEVLPDDDAGRDDVRIVCHHFVQAVHHDPGKRFASWAGLRAPWLTPDEIDTLISEVSTAPLRWSADALAKRMGLMAAERSALRISTIGAIDQTKPERIAARKERARKRAQERRRAQGAKPRYEYEANSLSRQKPWLAAGVSRSTWYRRRTRAV
jgi:hypothetical protein